jgi:hypothetical protein
MSPPDPKRDGGDRPLQDTVLGEEAKK